jgi:SAM-dependent methyltransferase
MSMNDVLKRFLPPVGGGNQHNREMWLEEALKVVPSRSRILDAGAGNQQYRRFCAHLDYVSQDFAQYDGTGDNAGLQMDEFGGFDYGTLDIVSDITSIPEPESSFDAIMCVEVFEHLPDPIQAVREFSRLLRPEGHLILTAPFCSLTHFAPYHFASGFDRYWYEKHLPDNGFRIDEISSNGNFFEFVAQEAYRVPYVSRRYARGQPNLLELATIVLFERTLLRMSKRDSGSSELLCYGYHVRARKV